MRSTSDGAAADVPGGIAKGRLLRRVAGQDGLQLHPAQGAFDSTANWMTKGELKEPFFAYINSNVTHESQIRAPKAKYETNTARLKPAERHDPAKVPLPPYYPDTPEVRQNVATYHENVTAMDYQVGDVLEVAGRQEARRQHGRLLLRRPRLGHAARQALAVRQRRCGAAPRPLAGRRSSRARSARTWSRSSTSPRRS